MNDVHDDIRAAVDAMCAAAVEREPATADTFDPTLWKELAQTGFTGLGIDERVGGSGGELTDLAVVVETAARHRARIPLAETTFLAGWLLGAAGLSRPDDTPMTASEDLLVVDRGDGAVSGAVSAPWGRHAGHAAVLVERAGELLISVFPLGAPEGPTIVRGANLAGEPRDTLVFDGCPLPERVIKAPAGVERSAILARGALARTVQLAGAADSVLAMSVRHAGEREQFGRSLDRFQAVQHHLAALAAEVSAVRTAAAAAVLAVQADAPGAALAVAAAKATASASAYTVATIGHQIHGAIGYSREHALGSATTRLLSWRDEFGSESHWQDELADMVLGSDSWWHALTS
ncbi:acyl-CoA dehydrogenase family protein [Actinomadura sp. LOL_016]|uniref:acyl-CoA dehydrogenase family protein n=1 Tax=unclassified Actinomadura TaxID=2626254 RepID=UPI003A80236B